MFKLSSLSLLYVSFFAMLGVAFLARVVNLHYNSPFNDEAIYVVLGRLGLFQGDWWLYNPSGWMAGQPYVYPPLSAIAYMTGGIVGSRFLNVLLGMLALEASFMFTKLLSKEDTFHDGIAALIATTIMAFSTASLYVSRLATYDILSYYFVILSLIFLLKAERDENDLGRNYFLGFLYLFLGLLTKITIGIYIPIIFLYSFYKTRVLENKFLYFWIRYFAFPLLIFFSLYLIYNFANLHTYLASQVARDKNSFADIWKTFWENTRYAWLLWVFSTPVLLIKKKWKLWVSCTFLSVLAIALHFISHREPTLDKHTFLTLTFLSPLIGIAFSDLIQLAPNKGMKLLTAEIVVLVVLLYSIVSYLELRRFNMLWHDSTSVLTYLSHAVRPGDKILAEVGASAILATYDNNFPTYTVTFDWFEYQHQSGDTAYITAIKDGYFDFIELDGGDQTSEQFHSTRHNLVLAAISGNYVKDYNQNGYVVYKRMY